MAWSDSMLIMLRVLINDVSCDGTYTYTDNRLKEILSVGAMYVNSELDFDTTYTVSVNPPSITPDPNSDASFMNLIVLKSACFVDWNTMRQKALLSGLEARCGPAILKTVGHLDGFKELLTKGPCAAYEACRMQWMFGNPKVVKAILSPFISNDFDPASLGLYSTTEDRSRLLQ